MADNPFITAGANAEEQKTDNKGIGKQVLFGVAFVGGMGAATVCNMSGYPGMAFGFGMIGLIGLVTFIGSLRADG